METGGETEYSQERGEVGEKKVSGSYQKYLRELKSKGRTAAGSK